MQAQIAERMRPGWRGFYRTQGSDFDMCEIGLGDLPDGPSE